MRCLALLLVLIRRIHVLQHRLPVHRQIQRLRGPRPIRMLRRELEFSRDTAPDPVSQGGQERAAV